ncbi:MAG TPA: universal stress protein [Polyangia bacterium]|nr:universal stress protein [Polyangia bacterium]
MDLQKILVAIDFSPDSDHAIDAALTLARSERSKIVLLHVCEPPPYSTPELGMYVPSPELMVDVLTRARRQLDRYRARCAANGADVDVVCIPMGFVADEIVDYASTHDFDLIVVGSHGRRGLRRFMLGSVAEKVVRTADRPVLTVHPHDVALAATASAV